MREGVIGALSVAVKLDRLLCVADNDEVEVIVSADVDDMLGDDDALVET